MARTREVDSLLDGFIFYLCVQDPAMRRRLSSILTSHSAFWSVSSSHLTDSIDWLMPATSVIVADTLTDSRHALEALRQAETTFSKGPASVTSMQTVPDIGLGHIPIVNRDWVLDTHSRYCVCDYEPYLWRNGLFSNLTFFLSDFKRDEAAVRRCIESNEGIVVADSSQAMFLLCPRTVTTDVYKDDRAVSVKWLKACVEAKRLVPRTELALFRPYPALLRDKTVCLTGFGHSDRVDLESYIVYE